MLALVLAVFQYLYNNKEKSQLHYWLSFLRFLSVFLILLLFINPSIKNKVLEIKKPNLIVAVDNSSSITYASQNTYVKNIVNQLKNDNDLNAKFTINYYSIGSVVKPLDSLTFKDSYTNISSAFNSFSKLYKENDSPVILITDGNQTVGNSIEFVAFKNPIFPLIVGDTTVVEDIYINQININKNTFIKNRLPVEIFVNYKGTNIVTKTLSVYHKSKKVYTQKLEFSSNKNVQTVSFYLPAEEKGIQYYTAVIEELENENNTVNNSKSFSINVIEEVSKILILSDIVHPDLGMLKKTIETNKQRTATIVSNNNFKGNISDYQLVILYQPTASFKKVFNLIDKNKVNYLVVTGLSTDWDFLNTNQTNFAKATLAETEDFLPVFNPNYVSFLTNDIGFSNFAPLEDSFGNVSFSVPYNTLLSQKIGAIETDKPLLATFETNNQKIGVLFGENSWRWRMNSYTENKTFELFDGFIGNIIQYLASNQFEKRLQVATNPIYFTNETIQISVSYLDENLNFDSRAKVWLTLVNNDTKNVQKIPFTLVENRFLLEFSNFAPAEYSFTVSVENQEENYSGSFKVVPFEVEKQFSNSNYKPLNILVSKTNGKTYFNNQQANLIADLLSDNRFKSLQKYSINKSSLINWKWLLGAILLLLSIEWFVRKYFGKV